MSDHKHQPGALVMYVHELGAVVEVWREGLGWWAKSARGRSQRGYPTPEHALRALTGSWPHETWIARVASAARRHAEAGAARSAGANVVPITDASGRLRRRSPGAGGQGRRPGSGDPAATERDRRRRG